MKFAAMIIVALSTFASVQGTEEDAIKCVAYILGDNAATATATEQCDAAAAYAHCGKKTGVADGKTHCESFKTLSTAAGDSACEVDCSGAFSIKTGMLATTALALLTSVVGLSL